MSGARRLSRPMACIACGRLVQMRGEGFRLYCGNQCLAITNSMRAATARFVRTGLIDGSLTPAEAAGLMQALPDWRDLRDAPTGRTATPEELRLEVETRERMHRELKRLVEHAQERTR